MTSTEYKQALHEIQALMETNQKSEALNKEGELIKLIKQVEQYEQRLYPMTRVLPHLL